MSTALAKGAIVISVQRYTISWYSIRLSIIPVHQSEQVHPNGTLQSNAAQQHLLPIDCPGHSKLSWRSIWSDGEFMRWLSTCFCVLCSSLPRGHLQDNRDEYDDQDSGHCNSAAKDASSGEDDDVGATNPFPASLVCLTELSCSITTAETLHPSQLQ